VAVSGNTPALLDLNVRQGADLALTVAVQLDAVDYDFTGATVTAKVLDGSGREQTSVTWATTTATGELVLALSAAETALIRSGWRWYVDVAKASLTQPWLAGALIPVAPGFAGPTSTTVSLSLATGDGHTLSISADPGSGIAAHLADTSDAHDASAISFAPTGTIAATDVQAAIAEVASEAIQASVLTTLGDLLTRGASAPDRVTRASLAQDAAFSSRYLPTVNHGSTAGTARVGTAPCRWIGSVDPTNGADDDELYRTDRTALYVRVSGAWVEAGSLRFAPSACVYLTGATGNYASTPDAAALDITGDLTLFADVAADDWTPGATMVIGGKGTSTQIACFVQVNTSSSLSFVYTTDGSTQVARTSTATLASVGIVDGQRIQIAVTLDADNGASGHDVRFWYRTSPLSSWTQLGTTVTTAGTITMFSGTSVVEVGGRNSAASNPFTGKLYRFQVFTGIGAAGVPGGTLVADLRADVPTSARYRDSTGKIWTWTGSAYAWTEV
jgi:hypothetical protein